MPTNSFKDKLIELCKRIYLKYCVFSVNFGGNIPKLPSKNKTRVLMISSDNNKVSGAFLSMITLSEILIKEYDLDVHVVLPYNSFNNSFIKSKNVPYTIIKSFGWGVELNRNKNKKFDREISDKKIVNNKAIEDIQEFIEINDIDLVHINTSYSYVGALAALKEKIPFIWHIREFLEEDQGNTIWDRDKGNALINKSTRVVAISDSIYEKYSRIIDDDKLVCIYNGIDSKEFYNPKKEILIFNQINFVFVGTIAKYKGIFEFANACVNLFEKGFNNFHVLIIGTGERNTIGKVKDIFNKAKMSEFVEFLGFKKDIYNYLKKTDVFFMCSKSEAFGRTTIEAMLSGNLVIGANAAGTKDIIIDGKTGILYESGNVNELCSKMIFSINNKDISRKIAKNGQKYAFENLTADINAKKIYNLYKSVL